MKRDALIQEIEAYAAAKASGNPVLAQRQGAVLQEMLGKLSVDLPEENIPALEAKE